LLPGKTWRPHGRPFPRFTPPSFPPDSWVAGNERFERGYPTSSLRQETCRCDC